MFQKLVQVGVDSDRALVVRGVVRHRLVRCRVERAETLPEANS